MSNEKTIYAAEFDADRLRKSYFMMSDRLHASLAKDESGLYFLFGNERVYPITTQDFGKDEFIHDISDDFFEGIPNATVVRVKFTEDSIQMAGIVEGGKTH